MLFTVSISPTEPVALIFSGNVHFQCHSISVDSIVSIQWLMNGSAILTNEAISSGNAAVLFDDGIGALNVINIPLEFNETSIQCHGVLTSGTNFTTESAILLLQGKMHADIPHVCHYHFCIRSTIVLILCPVILIWKPFAQEHHTRP